MVIEPPVRVPSMVANAVVARDMTIITAKTMARIFLVIFIVFVPFFLAIMGIHAGLICVREIRIPPFCVLWIYTAGKPY